MARSECPDLRTPVVGLDIGVPEGRAAEGSANSPGIIFGPFQLFAERRLLERAGNPVTVGSRALDILVLLVERAGEVVSKKELMAKVWPNVTVDENSLRVQIGSLRKALCTENDDNRYVISVSGRGYSFVAPIARQPKVIANCDRTHTLPSRLTRIIGRDAAVCAISELLTAHRCVTIVGSGGIGKTTVAVQVGHTELAHYGNAVRFVDFGSTSNARLVPSALAASLEISVQSDDPTPQIISVLASRRMLLILDNCEHVVEAVAILAEQILQRALTVAILATSREALCIEGEHVYRIATLENPPEHAELTARQVVAFPAAQLFVERIIASDSQFELSDEDAPIVARICRKLDGLALAIELVAGRAVVHGLRETASLLESRLDLVWQGRRTAAPRHRTLNAMINWSHDLLTNTEKAVLRRLSIFIGSFTLEAAQEAAECDELDASQIADAVGGLCTKSLISTERLGSATLLRMLETTREYALAKLAASGEKDKVAYKHALYYQTLLKESGARRDRSVSQDHLANARAALEWSFSNDPVLGVTLAAASVRLFQERSLFSECLFWCERAIASLDETMRGTWEEMELQSATGLSLMFTAANSKQALAAFERGLELANSRPDRVNRFRLFSRLHTYHRRAGHFDEMLEFALRARLVAIEIGDPVGIAAAESLVGVSHHLRGSQAEARAHLDAATTKSIMSPRYVAADFEFHCDRSRIALARTLWLLGCADQATRLAQHVIDHPSTTEPVTRCIVLLWGSYVFRWSGDWVRSEACIEHLISHAAHHGLAPYRSTGTGLKGEMLMRGGAVEDGVGLLRSSLSALRSDQYGLYVTDFNRILAQGLARMGRFEEAFEVIDQSISRVGNESELSKPELIRVRGELMESIGNDAGAERCFLQSAELAEKQSALSWRLRATNSLAKLWCRHGRCDDARLSLAEIYARFGEGFQTADLREARQILSNTVGQEGPFLAARPC